VTTDVPFTGFWSKYPEDARQKCENYYRNRLRHAFLRYEADRGAKRVPGMSTLDNSLVRRVL